jgi:hypothetical protein
MNATHGLADLFVADSQVGNLQASTLRTERPQDNDTVSGQKTQRLEPAAPLRVVLQQTAVDLNTYSATAS